MKSIDQEAQEFFEVSDETLTSAIAGIYTQMSSNNKVELLKLCNLINTSKNHLYKMSKKISQLPDVLVDLGSNKKIIEFKKISFRMNDFIDNLIDFTSKAVIPNTSTAEIEAYFDKLYESFLNYFRAKRKYYL